MLRLSKVANRWDSLQQEWQGQFDFPRNSLHETETSYSQQKKKPSALDWLFSSFTWKLGVNVNEKYVLYKFSDKTEIKYCFLVHLVYTLWGEKKVTNSKGHIAMLDTFIEY